MRSLEHQMNSFEHRRMILDNLLDFYHFRYTDVDGLKLTHSGKLLMYESIIPELEYDAFNRVVYCDTDESGFYRLLDRFKNKSVVFWTPPESKPDNIRELLANEGFKLLLDCPGMVLDMKKFDMVYQKPAGLSVKMVTDSVSLCDFTYIFNQEYDRKPIMGEVYRRRFERIMAEDAPWKRWVGYYSGKPVCISASFESSKAIGLYSISTLLSHRGKGFGLWMTAVPLLYARRTGIGYSVLQATDKSVNIYRKLGFVEICKYGFWRRFSVSK